MSTQEERERCPRCGEILSPGGECPACASEENEGTQVRMFAIAGGILFLLFAAGLIFYDPQPVSDLPSRPVTPSDTTGDTTAATADSAPMPDSVGPDDLAAQVARTDSVIVVRSRDTVSWSECRVSLNSELLEAGFYVDVGRISPNDSTQTGITTFANDTGERFDPARFVVRSVRVRCRRPGGWATHTQTFSPRPPPPAQP